VTRLAILAEGKTEYEFIKYVLAPYLLMFGIAAEPFMVREKRRKRGHGGQLGGNVSVDVLVLAFERRIDHFDFVTCLVDFYGFKRKGKNTASELEHLIMEGARRRLGPKACKVIPYVQLHEFEALLFSDVAAFASVEGVTSDMVSELGEIVRKCGSPEKINDHYSTCPSRRIQSVFPRFDKVTHGVRVAKRIGVAKMRDKCPRFGQWMSRLTKLAQGIQI